MDIGFFRLVGISFVAQIALKTVDKPLRARRDCWANVVHVVYLSIYCIYIQYMKIHIFQGGFSTELSAGKKAVASKAMI